MTEEKCKELIKKNVYGAYRRCRSIYNDFDEIDFNDIDWQIDQVMRNLETAKKRLKGCEDY